MSASKRIKEMAAKVGTHEWFLGLDEGKKADYLSKHPTSTFTKPARAVKEGYKARAQKGLKTKRVKKIVQSLDQRVPTTSGVRMNLVQRLRELAAENKRAGIGEFVKLKKPNGKYAYGQVKGWSIKKDKQGLGPAHDFIGGEIDKMLITLKLSPLNTSDYGPVVEMDIKDFEVLDARERQQELEEWNYRQPLTKGTKIRFNNEYYDVVSGPYYDKGDLKKQTKPWYILTDKNGAETRMRRAAMEVMYRGR